MAISTKTLNDKIYVKGIFKQIIRRIKRYNAPSNKNKILVSPITPPVKPKNISNKPGKSVEPSAFFITASGVALESPSTEAAPNQKFDDVVLTENDVIGPAKHINRKQRAAKAGFMKLFPSPPNSSFTTIIAKKPPITGIHSGIVDGKFIPSNKPVTIALHSKDVLFFPANLKYNNSAA